MEQKKSYYFFLLCMQITIPLGSYSLILPFFPLMCSKVNLSIDIAGLILCLYSVGGFLGSLSNVYLLQRFSKHNLILLFEILLISSFSLLSFISECKNKWIFIIVSCFSRLFSGFATTGLESFAYSGVSNLYEESSELYKKISILEACAGIGLTIGSSFGSVVHHFLNIKYTFLLYCLVMFIFTLISYLPNKEINSKKIENNENKNFSIMKFFKEKEIISYYFMFFLIFTAFLIYIPGLSINLFFNYNLSEPQISLALAATQFIYLFGSIIYSFITWKNIKSHPTISLFFLGISMLLIGPSNFLLKNNLIYCFIGLFLLSTFSIIGQIPVMSCFIDSIKKNNPELDSNLINEISGSLYLNGYNLAELISPVGCGYLTKFFGYGNGLGLFGIFLIFISLFYSFDLIYKGKNLGKENLEVEKNKDLEMKLINN